VHAVIVINPAAASYSSFCQARGYLPSPVDLVERFVSTGLAYTRGARPDVIVVGCIELFIILWLLMHVLLWLRNYTSDVHPIFVHVTRSHRSVLLYRRCDTPTLCTSGLWMASNLYIVGMSNCRYRCSEWRHCVVVRRLTRLLLWSWLRRVLGDDRRQDWTSPSWKGCRGRSLHCNAPLPCCCQRNYDINCRRNMSFVLHQLLDSACVCARNAYSALIGYFRQF